MRIETVEARNLKVPHFKYHLGAVNVCVGNNFVGKTAILQAVQLSLLGFVPGGIPKTNAGVFSLSAGPAMSVRLDLSDGKVIERSYVQKGETVKATERSSLTVPPVLLDAAEYLRLSERERLRYVFSLISLGDQTDGADILGVLERTPIDCDKEMTEAVVLAKKAILDRLGDWDRDRHDCEEAIQGWLEDVVNDLRERVKTTNAALGRFEKFAQASVALKAGDGALDAANVDRALREKRLSLQQAGEALAVARAKQDQASRDAATRRELERRLSEPFDAKAIESTRKQIADLEAAQVVQPDLGDLAFKVAEARGHVEAGKSLLRGIVADMESATRNYDLDLKAPACPHCGTRGKKFREAVEAKFRERTAELTASKAKTDTEIALANAHYMATQSIYETAAIADKKAQTDRLLLQSLRAEVTRLETLACNRATWTKQLAGLTVETVDQTAIQTMAAEVLVLQQEINALTQTQTRWIAAAHEAKRASEARQQRTQLEAELCALRAITKALEAITAQMVSEAFGKILSDANRFTTDILLSPLDYHDAEIGRWGPNHVWIPHRSFSGTEALLAGVALSIALCRQAPLKICLIDEAGRMTVANKRKLVERLLALTGNGFIDQAILVDVSKDAYANISGLNIIEI